MIAQSRIIAKGRRIRDIGRLVTEYGGIVSRWLKKSSPPFEAEGERAMIVQLKKGGVSHPSLTSGVFYTVIGIEADDYRILDDHGQPYLYEAGLFDVVDPQEPGDWISEIGEDGEKYAYPPALNRVGFFEDFFDGDAQTVSEFWHVVNQRLSRVA